MYWISSWSKCPLKRWRTSVPPAQLPRRSLQPSHLDFLKLSDNVSITCDDREVRAKMELLSVRSDFFARGFDNPGLMESQEKSLRMAGCSKAAMEAVKTDLYTGEMDFKQLDLDTLLYIMNISREILLHGPGHVSKRSQECGSTPPASSSGQEEEEP